MTRRYFVIKKVLSLFSALLSLCLLATLAFAAEPAEDGPVIFSFEVTIRDSENPRPSAPVPAPSGQNDVIAAPKIENSVETPEEVTEPSPDVAEDKPGWVKNYIYFSSGFSYPEIDPQAFADEIFRLTNEERVKAGLTELERREDVSPVTVIRAQELSELFSHTRPNGEWFMSLLDEYSIEYKWAGENGAKIPANSGPSGMMNGWMNSEGHRNNILNPKHTGPEIGVYQVGQMLYCSQVFIY